MRYFFLTLLFSQAAFAVNFGTGAEGNCSDADFTTARTYNCVDVTITGPLNITTGTDPLTILATGQITIGTLTLTVNNGANGLASSSNDLTTAAGIADGGSGGAYLGLTNSQRNGASGSGANPGRGGQGYPIVNPPNPNVNGNGAGGGGGGNGTAGGSGGAGSASSTTAGGSRSSDLGGGSGGGSGGAADDGIINSTTPGGGGAGGGYLILQGRQGVTINGTVSANGGNGGNGFNNGGATSGGGGGGSGGTIVIRTFGNVDLSSATINLAGGSGGAGGDGTNAGGAGGVGRLRLETAGGASVTTSGLTLTSGVVLEQADLFSNQFESKISSGCGSIDLDGNSNHFPTFLTILLILMSLPAIAKLKLKRRR